MLALLMILVSDSVYRITAFDKVTHQYEQTYRDSLEFAHLNFLVFVFQCLKCAKNSVLCSLC